MRAMVFRERQEKVAFLEAITRVVGRMYNLDSDKAFGYIVGEYAGEVFQETYDINLLRQKMAAIRRAQAKVRAARAMRTNTLTRLDRMGEFYDREYGPDLIPKQKSVQLQTAPTSQLLRSRKDPG